MRLAAVTAGVYAVLSVAFVVLWELEPAFLDGDGPTADAFAGALILAQPIAGFLVPRLWAFALPFLPGVIVLPFSEENYFGTDAGVLLLGGVVGAILMAFGMACRLTLDAFREPR